MPDVWLTNGNPWEMKRPEVKFPVAFGGKTAQKEVNGKKVTEWTPFEKVRLPPPPEGTPVHLGGPVRPRQQKLPPAC
jgi:hypothetical protein